MLKLVLTTLIRSHGCRPLCKKLIDTGLVCQVQLFHGSRCCSILDKDHPHKKEVEKARLTEEKTAEVDLDNKIEDLLQLDSMFPKANSHSMLINGVRYDELPIVHIKATHNNTIITVTDFKGLPLAMDSGGTVGFRNARKGTNIAAQAAAVSVAEKAVKKGVNTARVTVKGIGPGRLPAIKGIQMSGITIVSITDATPVPFNGPRPKKQRRL